MKYLFILLLICSVASTAQAQTVRVSTNSTGTVVPTQAGVDSAKRNIRNEIAALRAEMLRNVVTLRPGTVDSLNRLSVLLTDLSTRIAQQGASLSSLNATVAGNVAGDNAQAVAISNLQASVKEALSAGVLAQDMINQMKQYLKAIQ